MIRALPFLLLAGPAFAQEDWPELTGIMDGCEAAIAANTADPLRALGVVIGPAADDDQFGLVTVDGVEVTVLFLRDEVTPVCTILGLDGGFDVTLTWDQMAASAWAWSGGVEPEFDGTLKMQRCDAEPRPWEARLGPETGAYFPVPEGDPAPYLFEIAGIDPEECPDPAEEGET